MKVQKLNRRQVQWVFYLSRFDFTLKHIPGSKMGKADSLSRRPDWKVEVERDNENKLLVKPEWLEVRRIEKIEIIVERVDLLEKVRQSKVKDDGVIKTVEEMKQARIKMLWDKEWREIDGIIYKKGKVYVLKQTITLSGSRDISDLVSSDLVITDWSADNSVNTDCFETFLVLFKRSS